MRKLQRVGALLRAHLAEEAGSGFPHLTRTPSSGAIKFLDYVSALTAEDGDVLLDSLAILGAMRFSPPPVLMERMREFATRDPALLRYHAAMGSARFTMGLRHGSLRMARSVLADRLSVETMARTRPRRWCLIRALSSGEGAAVEEADRRILPGVVCEQQAEARMR